MKDGFEADAEMSDFERIAVFDTLRQHSDSLPVFVVEQRIVECIQCWTLQPLTTCMYTSAVSIAISIKLQSGVCQSVCPILFLVLMWS